MNTLPPAYPLQLPPVILASKSPRRQELLRQMGIEFTVAAKEIDESYPEDTLAIDVASYIAAKKMESFAKESRTSLVITADTVVVVDNQVLGKPSDEEDARRMLRLLSGRQHEVYTAFCLKYKDIGQAHLWQTRVTFSQLDEDAISWYIASGAPMDKAGAYGIQDWIGLNFIHKIEGSYPNVVGLPTGRLHEVLYGISRMEQLSGITGVEMRTVSFKMETPLPQFPPSHEER